MQYRPLCKSCGKIPAAVNYKRNGIRHFRSRCTSCLRKDRKQRPQQPNWMLKGYKKKPHCEKCGFKARYKEQLFVYYVDGNLNNADQFNLKTVCANCQYEIAREGLGWRQGDLTPDY